MNSFDIDANRVLQISNGIDVTQEVEKNELLNSSRLSVTANVDEIISASVYIITVPTPIDKYNRPDLTPLIKASETVGKVISKGDIVIYESTVYPGATEEDCVPVLEIISGFKFNRDFYAGYSPERINPGDKGHTLATIVKVSAGDTPHSSEEIAKTYELVVGAGVHRAPNIKVAEAAKIIETAIICVIVFTSISTPSLLSLEACTLYPPICWEASNTLTTLTPACNN